MRIGLFTNNYRPLVNGLVTSVASFARAFRAVGHEVLVVAPRYAGPAPDASEEAGVLRVPGLRAPTHHAYVLPFAGWPGVRRAVSRQSLDIYHAQHPFLLGPAAARWARQAHRPLVFTYHTRYERYAHYLPGPIRLTARLAAWRALRFAQQADLVIAPARSVARELQAMGLRRPVEVIPTGVPVPPLRPGARHDARQEFQLVGDPLCMSVGRLAPEKNLRFLLQAFRRILHALPAARLVLVGDGDDRPALLRLAHELGIADAVRLVGALPHERVSDYLAAADLFLFPSTSETQGLAALEALAVGLPVVAVASPAATDLFAQEQPGRLAPEDPEAFARQAQSLWRDPDRAGLSGAARRVAQAYTPEKVAARLLALYADLLQAYRVPREAAAPSEACR
jgi:1,2-diacylglycerol 3-alpha-glucosyltransferase